MQFLRIENPGVAPSEGFTLLGCSTSRYSGNKDVIGQFGSGTKHSINYLLRNNIQFYIYCGNLKLEFLTKEREVDDGIDKIAVNQVLCKMSGKDETGKNVNRTEELSWTTEHGINDWTNINMALREFVSNALDRAVRQEGNVRNVVVEVVNEKSVRAKNDHTRIYIEYLPYVKKFHDELPKRFLQFSPTGTKESILEKKDRNFNNKSAVIYRKGVFVRESSKNYPSLFDYNFGENLTIDECRNANEYDIIYAAMNEIVLSQKESVREKIINHLLSPKEKAWEDFFPLQHYNYINMEKWKETWDKLAGIRSVMFLGSESSKQLIENKGFKAFCIPEGWYKFLKEAGVPAEENILTDYEKNGIELLPASPAALYYTYRIWDRLANFRRDKECPAVFGFRKSEGSIKTKGIYKDGQILINEEVGEGIEMSKVVLEELAHHITGALDCSREFQEFFMDIIVRELFV